VTKDVSAGLRTTLEEAERIKVAYGAAVVDLVPEAETFTFTRLGGEAPTTLPARVLGEIIEPRMSELFHLVRQEINRSNFAGLLPAGMVLSGGGSLLRGARDLATTTGLPTRVGFPPASADCPRAWRGRRSPPRSADPVRREGVRRHGAPRTARRLLRRGDGLLRSVFRPVRP
jgi:cell division ATPase FtsA